MRKEHQMQSIDFEKDQEEVLDKTENIDKLGDKIKQLQALQTQLTVQEEAIKQKKKDIEHLSGEVIPTMLSEMGLSFLKLSDGSSVEVKTNYSATITQAKKEEAFNWLRQNGLGDIIRMKFLYLSAVTKITRQQIMLNLRGVEGSNQHKS